MEQDKKEEEVKQEEQQPVGPEVREEVQSSPEDVKPEVEQPSEEEPVTDPNMVDDDGVPWKNRAKELERKYHNTLEKFANFQRAETQPPADDNEEVTTRGAVKQVVSELESQKAVAEQSLDEVIEQMSIENPSIIGLKSKIQQQMKTVDIRQRGNPNLIKAVAFGVYGETTFKKKPEIPKPAPKKLVSSNDVLLPSPKGGNPSEISLTEDEKEYNYHHRLSERGWDNEMIHDQYVKMNRKK